MNQNYEPKIGDKLSIGHNCWYKPYTVVEIKNEKRIVVREEKAVYDNTDNYKRYLGYVKAVSIEENPYGPFVECRKNKNGYWKVWGCPDDWADFGEWRASEYWD